MRVEDGRADVVLLEEDLDDLLDGVTCLVSVGRRVFSQRLTKLLGHSDVVDDEAAGLVPEGTVPEFLVVPLR